MFCVYVLVGRVSVTGAGVSVPPYLLYSYACAVEVADDSDCVCALCVLLSFPLVGKRGGGEICAF